MKNDFEIMFDSEPDDVQVISQPSLADVLEISSVTDTDTVTLCPACCVTPVSIINNRLICANCGILVADCGLK